MLEIKPQNIDNTKKPTIVHLLVVKNEATVTKNSCLSGKRYKILDIDKFSKRSIVAMPSGSQTTTVRFQILRRSPVKRSP